MQKQQHFSEEQIEQHLREGTWRSLRHDDRVQRASVNMSVHSYLRRTGRKTEARQLWEQRSV
jgi:hypothetical protein